MLRFFKKVRQNLLGQNNLSKYFLYALGELILVVLGILIALGINNWNNERQSTARVNSFLKEVKSNLVTDTQLIDSIITFNNIKSAKLLETIGFYYRLEQGEQYRDSIFSIITGGKISDFVSFQTSRTGLDALLGSGELNLIPDDLRIKINEYYEKAQQQVSNNERTISLTRSTVQDQLMKFVSDRARVAAFTGLDIPPKKGMEKPLVLNEDIPFDMLFIAFIEMDRNRNLASLKTVGQNLIELIDAMLEEK